MKPLVRSELLKLTTNRTTRLLLLAALALALLLGTVTATTAGEELAAPLGNAASMANVVGVSAMPGFVMLILGVLATAGEYQHRTVTQTFLATPARGRVVAAKVVTIGLAGVAVALAMMGAALLAALPHVLAAGAGLDLLDSEVARTAAGTVAAAVLFGGAGVGLGALLRSQLAAVVAIGAWIVVGEALLGVVFGANVGRWLPGRAASALAGSDVEGLSLWAAAVLLAGYCAVIASVASAVTVRRDVS